MKSQTATHIQKTLGESFVKAQSTLGSFLANSTENQELQLFLRKEAGSKIQEMLKNKELDGLTVENDIKDLQIISSQIISIQLFAETTLIHWCADAVAKGAKWSIEADVTAAGSLMEGVDADKLVHMSGITGIDVINGQSASTVTSMSCLRKIEEVNGSKASTALLPFNKMAEHTAIPLKLTVEKDYAKIPAGTVLSLDSETMIYRDSDGGNGGVPADFILNLFLMSPPSCEIGKTFSVDDFSEGIPYFDTDELEEDEDYEEELSEAEMLGGFLAQTQGAPPKDDDIKDNLIDEILKRKKNNE